MDFRVERLQKSMAWRPQDEPACYFPRWQLRQQKKRAVPWLIVMTLSIPGPRQMLEWI